MIADCATANNLSESDILRIFTDGCENCGYDDAHEFMMNVKALAHAAQDSDSQTTASGVLPAASCSAKAP